MSTREKLCAVALKLFVAQGVEQTTTRQIAAAADVAEGTLYRHFASKDELAVDLFVRNWLAFATYMERAASRAPTSRVRLEAMLGWLLMAAERQTELFDYLFITPHGYAGQVARDVMTPVSLIKRELADLVPPAEVELRLALLLGGMTGAVAALRAGRLHSLAGALPHLLPPAVITGERLLTSFRPAEIAD